MFFVYILQSRRTGRFYIGQTDSLIARFRQHAAGEVRSTKGYRPWWMPYFEIHDTRTSALRRERELKNKKSSQSLRRVIARGYQILGLPSPLIQ